MVEDVKEVGSELKIEPFSQVELSSEREIQLRGREPSQTVTAEIPLLSEWSSREGSSIDALSACY
jgi:hypothetical protein